MVKLKYILVFLLIINLLAVSGCGLFWGESNSSNASDKPIDTNWEPIYVEDDEGDFIDTTYSYADLIDKVSPVVVSIVTETIQYNIFQTPYPQEGAGTGIIVDPQGYIVTNNHVVEGAQKVTVTLSTGESIEARRWVGDSETDLAVVEIEKDDLPYARFLRNSLENVRIGDKVVAIGNAAGRGIASTEGTVSFLGEAIQEPNGEILYDLIRTSAPINPGNSGGPLVNMAGQVVGINVAIAPEYENLGFAISTNTAIPVIYDLVTKAHVPNTWLGVRITTVTPAVKSDYDLYIDYGVLIVEVLSGSPAEEAGLRSGDVIVEIDEEPVNTDRELGVLIRSHEAGDKITIKFFRGHEELTTEATLEQRPSS